jgi:hypothetical protein
MEFRNGLEQALKWVMSRWSVASQVTLTYPFLSGVLMRLSNTMGNSVALPLFCTWGGLGISHLRQAAKARRGCRRRP